MYDGESRVCFLHSVARNELSLHESIVTSCSGHDSLVKVDGRAMRKNMRRRVSPRQWRVCHPLVILLHASCVCGFFFFQYNTQICGKYYWIMAAWELGLMFCLASFSWISKSAPRVVLQVGKVAHDVLCWGGWREIQPNTIRHSLGIFALDNSKRFFLNVISHFGH